MLTARGAARGEMGRSAGSRFWGSWPQSQQQGCEVARPTGPDPQVNSGNTSFCLGALLSVAATLSSF